MLPLSTLNGPKIDRRRERKRRDRRRFHAPTAATVRDGIAVTVGKRSHRERRRPVDAVKSVKLVIRRGFAHALACAGSTFVSCFPPCPRRNFSSREGETSLLADVPRTDFLEAEKRPRFLSSVSRHELDFCHCRRRRRLRCQTVSALFRIRGRIDVDLRHSHSLDTTFFFIAVIFVNTSTATLIPVDCARAQLTIESPKTR